MLNDYAMFKIEAIIRSQKLESVQAALEEIQVSGITVTEVRGSGRQKGYTHTYRGSQYTLSLTPRVKVEVIVTREQLQEAVDAVVSAAATGEVGDGKVFVVPVVEAVRIRTGEKGDLAIS